MSAPAEANEFLKHHVAHLLASHRRWTGRDLLDPTLDTASRAKALWNAAFVVASHGAEADPVFNYGNQAALALFETSWDEFTAMPSRLSAEPIAREERARLLARVTAHGYIDDYSGVRVTTRGRRFRIHRATVWNVEDENGQPAGQAVVFSEWQWL